MRPIRVAWVNDIVGSLGRSPEEEVAEEIVELQEDLGYKMDLVAHDRFMENVDQLDIDLLVFDYGGASSSYSDTPWTQLEAACRWAQEHPGRLVLLYTTFTGKMYRNLLRYESAKNLGSENIMYWWPPTYAGPDEDEAQKEHVKAWFVGGDFEPYWQPDPNPPHAGLKVPKKRPNP